MIRVAHECLNTTTIYLYTIARFVPRCKHFSSLL